MSFFGYSITKKAAQKEDITSKVREETNDGAVNVMSNNVFGVTFSAEYNSSAELIDIYREMSLDGVVDVAIDDIVNESIVPEPGEEIAMLDLSKTGFSDNIQKKIIEEWDEVLKLYKFNTKGQDLFRKWYIDGIIYAYKISTKPENNISGTGNDGLITDKKGLSRIKILDPRDVKFIREEVPNGDGSIKEIKEYYLYSDRTLINQGQGIVIMPDAITRVTSGKIDLKNRVLSSLHPAIKPYNQLISLEDSVVVYRMVRAPERRIFFIDVGELPKTQAEAYMTSIMNKHKNKMVYDAATGKMKENANLRSMLEDVWLPRRDGGRGTDVQTLQGGQNLGEMDDVNYFKKRLHEALKLPLSRLEDGSSVSIGPQLDVTRDELKFAKYLTKLKTLFSYLLTDTLKTQLILKRVITELEWLENNENIHVAFNEDAHFAEIKQSELLKMRLENVSIAHEFKGIYISEYEIQKNILKRSDEEILETAKKIQEEGSAPSPEDV